MRVLIVAKTHMMGEFCVGGLARETNQNIRLLEPGGQNQPVDTAYEVGQIWEIEFSPRPHVIPPHVEDVIVERSQYVGKAKDVKETLLKRVQLWRGGPDRLFDGLIRFTESGGGYISERTGIPRQSVGFWLSDRALQRTEQQQRIRYYTPDYRLKLSYVGTAEAIDILPAETLLRVSLARWWQPYHDPSGESRCHLQLSGWFL
jgi:hypothetical protein